MCPLVEKMPILVVVWWWRAQPFERFAVDAPKLRFAVPQKRIPEREVNVQFVSFFALG
jgi:hypothetical protein